MSKKSDAKRFIGNSQEILGKSLAICFVLFLVIGLMPTLPDSAQGAEVNTVFGKLYTGKSVEMTYTGSPVKLRWSNYYAEGHMVAQNVWKPYIDFLQTESNGRIVFDPQHWGGTLHGLKDGYRMCRSNTTDVTQGYTMNQAQSFHLMNVTELPFALPNTVVASLVMEELYPKYFKAEYESVGVYLNHWPFVGSWGIVSKKPIRSMEDLKGLKVRTDGSFYNDIYEALGAKPVFMVATEQYNAFSKGVFDATSFYTGLIVPWKLHEIGKYFTLMPSLGLSSIPCCINTKTFDSLPKDAQKDLYLLNRRGGQLLSQGYFNMDKLGLQQMRDNGMEVIVLGEEEQKKWRKALEPLWEKFIVENEAAGRPARQLVADMKALVEKYKDWSPEKIMDHVTQNPVHGIITGF